jgi:hypothetical protein
MGHSLMGRVNGEEFKGVYSNRVMIVLWCMVYGVCCMLYGVCCMVGCCTVDWGLILLCTLHMTWLDMT